EADCLLDTLENYLHKHKFCSECKLKVLEAYDILLDNGDNKHRDKKGYCPALYEGKIVEIKNRLIRNGTSSTYNEF
ncbi:unnamed protein product, partial [Rotaria magnacalcarata]